MALKYCSRMNSLLMARMLQAQTTEQILHSHISQTIINPGMHTHTCCKHPAADFHRIIGPQGHPQSILSHVSSWHRNLARLKSGAAVSRFTQDIDIEKLREEVKKESKMTGQQIQVVDKIKEIVATRCAETIANLDEDGKKRLKVLQLEHNFLYSEGHDIPSSDIMTDEAWVEAMELSSKNQRLKYYLHLQKRVHTKKAFLLKRAALKEEMKSNLKNEDYEHGRIFMRIYEQTMRRWLNYHLARSMEFGTPLVFDMDYEHHMRPQEIKNTAKQLHDVYVVNRGDPTRDPFHLHFANCQPNNAILRLMEIKIQDNPFLLNTVTEKSYLDLFDKDRLVYLSPQGRQVMREFDPEAVYIIGAFNDKATQKPISYARAMEQGIKCRRFPIDEYLIWNQGTKSLTLDQMMRIMLDLKNNLPWKTAFRHVPQRKLR